MSRNIEKQASTKKPIEPEIVSNEVIIEEIEKGNSDGKSAVKGKKVSIFNILSTSTLCPILMLSQFPAPLGRKCFKMMDGCFRSVYSLLGS